MERPPPPLNPLYSDNRLKLGVFGANVSNGCAATTAPGHLEMTWANSSDIVTTADHAGFEALVPVARCKGFGGATNFNGDPLLTQPGQRLAGNVST
jgi:dimethylsulfone monooxygenase